MRDEPEIGGGIGVAEGSQRRSQPEVARDGFQSLVRQRAVRPHHRVALPAHQTRVDMQTAAGLARSDLRRERHVHAVLAGQRADDPFGHHELIGGGLEVRGKEFDLVLLVHAVALREVPHLGVTVLDLAARLGDVFHGLAHGTRRPC